MPDDEHRRHALRQLRGELHEILTATAETRRQARAQRFEAQAVWQDSLRLWGVTYQLMKACQEAQDPLVRSADR